MSAPSSLSGALWLRPGQPVPRNLRSTRPDVVQRLVRGRPAQALPVLLGSLFALCGHAHRLCAGLAVQAAQGGSVQAGPAALQALRLQTLREHVTRIALDWPQLQLAAPPGAPLLPVHTCPLFAREPALAGLADWLQAQVFHAPLAGWLAAWRADAAVALRTWTLAAPGPVAALLRDAPVHAGRVAAPVAPLHVHADSDELRTFAAALRADDGLHRRPQWRGACAETGPWTRLADRGTPRIDTPVLRAAARLAEVARLALPDGDGLLQCGALALAPGEAVAWVEMSRGLLLHHVVLQGQGGDACVAACRVVAPTEWNFHAEGAVARQLAALPVRAAGTEARLPWLLAAYDACVPTIIEAPALGRMQPAEAGHA